jgi:hypothetical protein
MERAERDGFQNQQIESTGKKLGLAIHVLS